MAQCFHKLLPLAKAAFFTNLGRTSNHSHPSKIDYLFLTVPRPCGGRELPGIVFRADSILSIVPNLHVGTSNYSNIMITIDPQMIVSQLDRLSMNASASVMQDHNHVSTPEHDVLGVASPDTVFSPQLSMDNTVSLFDRDQHTPKDSDTCPSTPPQDHQKVPLITRSKTPIQQLAQPTVAAGVPKRFSEAELAYIIRALGPGSSDRRRRRKRTTNTPIEPGVDVYKRKTRLAVPSLSGQESWSVGAEDSAPELSDDNDSASSRSSTWATPDCSERVTSEYYGLNREGAIEMIDLDDGGDGAYERAKRAETEWSRRKMSMYRFAVAGGGDSRIGHCDLSELSHRRLADVAAHSAEGWRSVGRLELARFYDELAEAHRCYREHMEMDRLVGPERHGYLAEWKRQQQISSGTGAAATAGGV
jgi:hypothetical protein